MILRDAAPEPGVFPVAPSDVRRSAIPQPGLATPRTRPGSSLLVLGTLGILVAAVAAALVAVYLLAGLGTGAFVVSGILALVPLTVVLLGVRWIDRWDPEPRGALLFAFLWGAGVSVIIALLVGAEVDNVVNSLGGPGAGYEFFGAVIQAPLVEEGGKSLGVLLLFLTARRHFDGPVDGVVYAAMVAGGFAFTENILYFGQALAESGGNLAGIVPIFLMRGLLSPFAHVMFTSCVGVVLGIAASRRSSAGWPLYLLAGFVPAVALHALWNGSLFFVSDFFGYYAVVQVPLFILAIVLVVYLRRQEARVTRDNLAAYARAGWFNAEEVGALATAAGRRTAMTWARSHGIAPVMKTYIRDATRLAFTRQRIETGIATSRAQADESRLLDEIVETRSALRA